MSTRALAEALVSARRHGAAAHLQAAQVPADAAAAYAVQEAVLRSLAADARPTAWKVSPPQAGREPLASPVPPLAVHASPARLPAPPGMLGIECEIAFRFREEPAPGIDRDALATISEALVLVELCASRLADFASAPPLAKLADFQSNAALVLGTGIADWGGIDFTTQAVTVSIAGRPAATRRGSHPTGDLAAMLAWSVGHCARRGWPLRAGDVVTTGSWTGISPLAPGEQAIARFDGIGEARLTLAA